MSNDILDPQHDLLEQKDAIKSYLDCLFDTTTKVKLATNHELVEKSIEHIPHWAKSGFSALSFRSAGLHLYVPVSFVRGIKNIGGKIDKVKNASEWIKGSVSTRDGQIIVIDSEKLVTIDKERTVSYHHPDENAYVILLGDGSYGLCCDTVGQVKQIAVGEVHWRVSSTKRRWLAGMFKNEVAALIDARRVALALSMDSTLV